MKPLTKKQKIEFCEHYLKLNNEPSGFYRQFVCDEIADYFDTYKMNSIGGSGISEMISEIFPELFAFNSSISSTFYLSLNKGFYYDENKIRLTVIAFVLAILKSEK